MSFSEKVRFSLRTKLFVLLLTGFVILVGATLWQIGHQANRASVELIKGSLAQTKVVLDTNLESKFAAIEELANGIAGDSRILPLVFEGAAETLQDQCSEFEKVLEFDALIFTDAYGEVLARSDRPEMVGFSLAGVTHYFDSALAGKPARGFLRSQGNLMQVVSVPVVDNVVPDRVRGTVSLAFKLDRELADEINALTTSNIGFIAFERDKSGALTGVQSIYNTSPELTTRLDNYMTAHPDLWHMLFQQHEYDDTLFIDLESEHFLAVVKLLANEGGPPLGFIIALRSQAELRAPFMAIQRTVLVIGVVCAVLASLFAWLFARSISQPIVQLVSVTKAIEEGDYSVTPASLSRSDEVGVLHRAVIRMGTSLREKAELEDYLAQMSNELDENETLVTETQRRWVTDAPELAPEQIALATEVDNEDLTVISPNNAAARSSAVKQPAKESGATVIDHRYQVVRSIGKGAMGTVYLANDKELDEQVAIKVVSKEIFNKQGVVDIKEEIRLARRITHRNILRTYDFGEWQNNYYITMEYISGYNLSELIAQKGALDLYIGILMSRQICTAMAAAHAQNIVHLDLKPANMMVNRQGILKIMDFGLARTFVKESLDQINQTANTTVEFMAGTPRFMAPEQFTSKKLDARTDIYSIGIIMINLFTGAPPFTADSFMEIAFKHMQEELPPLVGTHGPLPQALVDIVTKATAKEAKNRYQSVAALLRDINRLNFQ